MIFRSIAVLALITPFFFPWFYAAVAAVVAAIRYPVVVFVVGIEIDALYYVHSATSFPYASAWGFVAMAAALFFRRLAKTYLIFS